MFTDKSSFNETPVLILNKYLSIRTQGQTDWPSYFTAKVDGAFLSKLRSQHWARVGRCPFGKKSADVVYAWWCFLFLISPSELELLHNIYPEWTITWPLHLPDLNMLDFFLWWYLKSIVCAVIDVVGLKQWAGRWMPCHSDYSRDVWGGAIVIALMCSVLCGS